MPPYSSGIVTPNSPSSFICSTIASGNLSSWSNSSATGRISLSTNWRTISVIAFCSSVFSCKVAFATAMAREDTARMSNVERLVEALGTVFTDGETEVDAALIDRMIAVLAPITADDVEVLMTGSDDTFATTRQGLDGLRAGWVDWLDAFGRIRFEIEGLEQFGDNVLTLGRQVGVTRTGGVE